MSSEGEKTVKDWRGTSAAMQRWTKGKHVASKWRSYGERSAAHTLPPRDLLTTGHERREDHGVRTSPLRIGARGEGRMWCCCQIVGAHR